MSFKKVLKPSLVTIGLSALVLFCFPKGPEPIVENPTVQETPTIKPAPKEEIKISEKTKGIEYNLGNTLEPGTPIKDLPYGLEGRIIIKDFDVGEELLTLNFQLKNVTSESTCQLSKNFAMRINELCYLNTRKEILEVYWDVRKDKKYGASTILHFEKVKACFPEEEPAHFIDEEPARFVLGTTPAEQTPVIRNLPFGLEGRINIERFNSPEREMTLNLRLRNTERVSEQKQECIIKNSMILKQSESCYIQKEGELIELHWEVEQIKGIPNAVLYLE